MTYLLLYIAVLLLPGTGIALRLNFPISVFLPVALLVSYSLFVFVALAGNIFGLAAQTTVYIWISATGLFSVYSVYELYRRTTQEPVSILKNTAGVYVFLSTFTAVTVYLLWVGPYVEVPADVWWHLGRMQDAYETIDNNNAVNFLNIKWLFNKNRGYWYLLHSSIVWLSGHSIESALSYVAFLNPLVFLVAVYGFAVFLFENDGLSKVSKHFVAAVSVLFFITFFGVSVFAYVRYYSLAPSMLNYVIYFACIATFMLWLREKLSYLGSGVLIASGAIAMTAVHIQEAMFLALAMASVAVYLFIANKIKSERPFYSMLKERTGIQKSSPRRVFLFTVAIVVAYLAAHIYMFAEVHRHSPLKHARMMDIHTIVPFLQNLFILDPTKNIYAAVTVWGIFVYFLFFKDRLLLKSNAYISATMLVPFLTMLNPVFVDFFLRISWPELMWRICYMLPLPFVAAYFFVSYTQALRTKMPLFKRAGHVLAVFLLIFLLFPFESRYAVAKESRFITLGPVPEANTHHHWADLFEYLDTLPKHYVLTDRITGYMVNGLTHHVYYGYKFYGYRSLRPNIQKPNKELFTRHKGWLLIVNNRDGAKSEAGRISGHWKENMLKVSGSYSKEFLKYVADNPELFELKWQADNIKVYEVKGG